MIEAAPNELKQTVESRHGCKATFVQAVPVHEERGGQVVWDGIVHVFDLKHQADGHFRAYAWSHGMEDGQRRFVTALHTQKVNSPALAVRADMVAEQK
jgi:hypothetical protein